MKKTVLITGASSGIGLVIANKLHRSGFQVFGTSRNPERYQRELPFKLLPLDITSQQSIDDLVAGFFNETGRLDVLINNAGNMLSGLVEETTLEQGRQQFETNFWGTVRFTQALLPHLRQQRSGQIITIGSVMGRVGLPSASYYAASKHALEGFFKSLRFELKPFHIRVSVVGPTFFKTNIDKSAVLSSIEIPDYDVMRSRLRTFADASMQQAPTPEPIADKVLEIIHADQPGFNYPVGKGASLLPFLQNAAYKQFEKSFVKRAKL